MLPVMKTRLMVFPHVVVNRRYTGGMVTARLDALCMIRVCLLSSIAADPRTYGGSPANRKLQTTKCGCFARMTTLHEVQSWRITADGKVSTEKPAAGAKARRLLGLFGTTKVVPFYKTA